MVIAGLLWGAAPAAAQDTKYSTLQITVATVLYVASTTSSVSFSPNASHFAAGSITATGGTVTYAGNLAFQVQIAANAATWSGITKPATDLQWSRNSGSTWNSLSTTAASFHTSSPAAAARYDVPVQYRVLLPYSSTPPGTYTLGLTYTVVAN